MLVSVFLCLCVSADVKRRKAGFNIPEECVCVCGSTVVAKLNQVNLREWKDTASSL